MAKLFCGRCEAKLDAGARPAELRGCKECPPPPQSKEWKAKYLKGAAYVCVCSEPFLTVIQKSEHQKRCPEALAIMKHQQTTAVIPAPAEYIPAQWDKMA